MRLTVLESCSVRVQNQSIRVSDCQSICSQRVGESESQRVRESVTLPLNVSLDVGLEVCTCGLGEYSYTRTYVESCDMEITRSLTTLGYETMVTSGIQVEKGIEPLDLAE